MEGKVLERQDQLLVSLFGRRTTDAALLKYQEDQGEAVRQSDCVKWALLAHESETVQHSGDKVCYC